MMSLRRRLLRSLWLTLVLVGTASAVATFFVSRQETNSLLDFQMQQIATFIGAQAFSGTSTSGIIPNPNIDHDVEEAYAVSVRDAAGKVLYASRPEMAALSFDWLGFRRIRFDQQDYQVFSAQSGNQRIAVAQQTELRKETAAEAAFMALLPVLILIPTLGLVISFVIRRRMQPLTVTAREVAERPPLALDALPVVGLPSEVLPLITEINRLLERLRAANEHERRFIADAAHALRTPLAALQLQADVLDGSTEEAKRTERIVELRAGIKRAVKLSNQLLLLSRDETATGPVQSRVALDAATSEVYALHVPIAAARRVHVHLRGHSGALVPGTTRHIGQLIGNLLDNALRHTPADSSVVVSLHSDADRAHIDIIDEGPGLADTELENVFGRFYRSPGDMTDGSGLGLAVVREIARQLGGQVQLENRVDRSGLIAHVWLPRAIDSQLNG